MNLTEEQRKRAEKGLPLPQAQGFGATRKVFADVDKVQSERGVLAGIGAGAKAGLTLPLALAQDLLPNTSAVQTQSAQARKDLTAQGRIGAAVGEGVRGALATVPALVDDTYGAAFRAVAPQVADFGRQFSGANDEPAAPQTPNMQAAAAQPKIGMPQAGANLPGPSNQTPTTDAPSASASQDGVVTKSTGKGGRVTYSGQNVSEGFAMADGKGTQLGVRGGMSTVPGMGQAEIDRTLNNANGTRWSERDNAIMAANIRDGVDPYRGTSAAQPTQGQAAVQQMLGAPRATNTLTPKQMARIMEIGAGIDNNAATQRSAATRAQLEQEQLQDNMATNQVKRSAAQMELNAAQELATLRSQFMSETDPAKRAELASTMRALSGKGESADEWTPTRMTTVNPDGTRNDSVVLTNKRTGETRPADGLGVQQPQQAGPELVVGQTYTDASGKKARWDGTKFVEIK